MKIYLNQLYFFLLIISLLTLYLAAARISKLLKCHFLQATALPLKQTPHLSFYFLKKLLVNEKQYRSDYYVSSQHIRFLTLKKETELFCPGVLINYFLIGLQIKKLVHLNNIFIHLPWQNAVIKEIFSKFRLKTWGLQ